jgi:hypothetical protein
MPQAESTVELGFRIAIRCCRFVTIAGSVNILRMTLSKLQTHPDVIQSISVAQRNGSLIELSREGWIRTKPDSQL